MAALFRREVRLPLQETQIPQPTSSGTHICLSKKSKTYRPNQSESAMTENNNDRYEHVAKSKSHSNNATNDNVDGNVIVDTSHNCPKPRKDVSCFVVQLDDMRRTKKDKKGDASSLQDAFQRFRQAKQYEIKQYKMMKERELVAKRDQVQMETLRAKFVATAKKYFGVPYAKKYHQPGTPEYAAPLFLDCCALVRQVLRDLKEEFGFSIGPWNQCYQYDTLPITVKEEDMKPGDLVFISGTYFNKKSKPQRHNMVHVEIWAGDGPKTIGARWQKGKVEVFDTYWFEAKSYHSMQYHFKSIDTWLQGICKSHCSEHAWTTTKYDPGQKSIFSVQQQKASDHEQDEGAGDTEDDLIDSDSEHVEEGAIKDDMIESDAAQCTLIALECRERGRGNLGKVCEEIVEENGHEVIKNSSRTMNGDDEETTIWKQVERSPVHIKPRLENDLMVTEERCWESIECERVKSNPGKTCYLERELKGEKEMGIGHDAKEIGLNFQVRAVLTDMLEIMANHTSEENVNSTAGVNHVINSRDCNHNKVQLDVESGQWSRSGQQSSCSMGSLDERSLHLAAEKASGNIATDLDQEGMHQKIRSGEQQVCTGNCGRDHMVCSSRHEWPIDSGIRYDYESWQGRTDTIPACQRNIADDNLLELANDDGSDTTSLDEWTYPDEDNVPQQYNNETMPSREATSACQLLDYDNNASNNLSVPCCHGTRAHSHQQVESLRCLANKTCIGTMDDVTYSCHGDDLFNGEAVDGDNGNSETSTGKNPPAAAKKAGRASPGKKPSQRSQGKSPDEPSDPSGGSGRGRNSVSRPSPIKELGPAFYIGGGNGVALVEGPLLARGWHRIHDRHSSSFKLKWVELKTHISYNTFKSGEQLVNRIPNTHLLATKTGLYNTLREYERLQGRTNKNKSAKALKMNDFFAESFVLDVKADREAFFQTFKEGEIWICKPNGMNQGKGIYLVRDTAELRRKYDDTQEGATTRKVSRPAGRASRLIQRYIPNPLLLEGKKFDVRTYMLIACTNPFVVLFHSGYLRLACDDYDADSTDLHRHLTNQYQQKKHPSYQDVKEDTVWSMEKFNDCVNEIAEEKGLPKDWVMGYFHKQMMKIMVHCFNAVKNKLDNTLGFFDLLGFDFLIDTDMKVWLIEINVNPALHTNCEVLRHVMPGIVEETLDIVLEVFEKSRRKRPIMPITSQRNYKLLYNSDTSSGSSSSSSNENLRPTPKSTSPRRSPTRPLGHRSTSPPKRKTSNPTRPVSSVRQNVTKVSIKLSKEELGKSKTSSVQEENKDAS